MYHNDNSIDLIWWWHTLLCCHVYSMNVYSMGVYKLEWPQTTTCVANKVGGVGGVWSAIIFRVSYLWVYLMEYPSQWHFFYYFTK